MIDAYVCTTCEELIITIQHDEGTAPPSIPCFASEGCSGDLVSVREHIIVGEVFAPTHVWERVDGETQVMGLRPIDTDHIEGA